jgi:hypothetical protein
MIFCRTKIMLADARSIALFSPTILRRLTRQSWKGFREFQAPRRTIQGYEAVHVIRKGQVRWVAGDDLLRPIQFIDSLFELAA